MVIALKRQLRDIREKSPRTLASLEPPLAEKVGNVGAVPVEKLQAARVIGFNRLRHVNKPGLTIL